MLRVVQDVFASKRKFGRCPIIVDLTFRILTCRFLLAVVSVREIWLISTCHSRQGISCARAPLRPRNTSITHCIFGFVHQRGHHALRESSCVSLAHGPRWLFLLSRHRKAISAAANQKPFVNKHLCTRKSVKRTIKW